MSRLEVGVKVVWRNKGHTCDLVYVVNRQTDRNMCKQSFVSWVVGCSLKDGVVRTGMCVHTCLSFIARSTYPYTVHAWGE
jgi:hypothetical protein